MKKVKIAISLDKNLLDDIDAKVDGDTIRSRSQAIEVTLRNGLKEKDINDAVILISGKQHELLLKKFKEKELIRQHIEFFIRYKIKNIIITTQHTRFSEKIHDIVEGYNAKYNINIEVVEKNANGNAEALSNIKDRLKSDFIIISGDIYNNFELKRMIEFHKKSDMLGTMGLMTRKKVGDFGVVILEGDKIIDFKEKTKSNDVGSLVVNAGVYILRPEIFELYDEKTKSLEKDLFPKLARIKQLHGYFTYGEYCHMEEIWK